MRMIDLQPSDRPREKLQTKGAAALSDFELLQAMIGSGNRQANVGQIAKQTQKLLQKQGSDITYDQLQKITGLGSAKITELLAAFELSRRHLIDSDQPTIYSTEDAVSLLEDIRGKKQEYFVCLTLDGAHRLIAKRTITIGTLTSSLVHPREVFADAITDRAASIIVAHNHPSGNPKSSQADREVTKRLLDVADLIGIKLVEHIIITKSSFEAISEIY
jgi:DNA repair protein RadC